MAITSAISLTMAAFLIMLVSLAPTLNYAASLADQDATLADRMDTLERLVMLQGKRIEKLETENKKLTVENAQLKKLEADVSVLKKKVKLLEDIAAAANGKSNEIPDRNFHDEHQQLSDVVARSDDAGQIESVLNQISQQLTEVSAKVEVNKAELQNLRQVDQNHTQAIQAAATSVYTRWGHSGCPGSNDLVYSGVVGGEWYDNRGAATNYVCLTMSPKLLDSPSGIQYWAQMYGAEYFSGDSHLDKNAVCAVCRSPRPTVVMVPGTNVCWSGWTLEYSGYIMAGEPGHVAGSEFICVDSALQNSDSGDGRQNGAFLVYTLTYCGYSLPCSPYSHKKLLTCAVCSK